MENKYYTPQIEEFCVNFQYERMNGNTWEQAEMTKLDFYSSFNSDYENEFEEIDKNIRVVRVKYLDSTDIQELGWIVNEWKLTKTSGEVRIRLHPMFEYNHLLTIERKDFVRNASGDYNILPILSRAVVKNKHELNKVMQMLNIK
jgi:hypothetical protein